jgi:hypothetical protein
MAMDEEINHRTTRDQLTYEMLGDIGRLHDKVESLKKFLPAQMEEVESRIAGLIGLLSRAGDAYESKVKEFTGAELGKARELIQREGAAAKAQFDRDTNSAIKTALAEVQQTVERTVHREVSMPLQTALGSPLRMFWPAMLACFMCGILGSLVFFGFTRFVVDRNEPAYADMGRAVTAVWDKLDAKAKAVINLSRAQ